MCIHVKTIYTLCPHSHNIRHIHWDERCAGFQRDPETLIWECYALKWRKRCSRVIKCPHCRLRELNDGVVACAALLAGPDPFFDELAEKLEKIARERERADSPQSEEEEEPDQVGGPSRQVTTGTSGGQSGVTDSAPVGDGESLGEEAGWATISPSEMGEALPESRQATDGADSTQEEEKNSTPSEAVESPELEILKAFGKRKETRARSPEFERSAGQEVLSHSVERGRMSKHRVGSAGRSYCKWLG